MPVSKDNHFLELVIPWGKVIKWLLDRINGADT